MTPQEQNKYVLDNYLRLPIKQIGRDIGRSGSWVRLELKRQGLTVPPEVAQRHRRQSYFKKGNIPFNKGLKISTWMTPEMIEQQAKNRYKVGQKPHNTLYDGCRVRRKDSSGHFYWFVRIRVRKWVLLHRYLWEHNYGPIPPHHNIQFKDGDTDNIELDNLYIIHKKDAVRINKNGGNKLPYEIKKVIQLNNKLKRKIDEKQNYRLK